MPYPTRAMPRVVEGCTFPSAAKESTMGDTTLDIDLRGSLDPGEMSGDRENVRGEDTRRCMEYVGYYEHSGLYHTASHVDTVFICKKVGMRRLWRRWGTGGERGTQHEAHISWGVSSPPLMGLVPWHHKALTPLRSIIHVVRRSR